MPDPQDDDLDRSPLAVATRYSDGLAALPRLPPLPGEGEIRGTGPGESRDPFAVANGTFEDQQAQALSPTMGAYGMGQLAADTYQQAKDRNWSGVAANLPILAAAMLPVGRAKPLRGYHGTPTPWEGPFDPSRANAGPHLQPRPYFADSPEEASGYALARDQTLTSDAARGAASAPSVIPADINIQKPFNGSMNGPDGYNYVTPAQYKKLVGVKPERDQPTGYDIIKDMYVQEADKLLPPEIRATKNAEFDPNVKGYYGHIYDSSIGRQVWENIYKRLEKAGYDGIVEPNTPADYQRGKYTKIIPFKQGTVTSATTGEPLFADGGGVPPYPGDAPDSDFPSMLANNPHGWGNAPPIPHPVQEQEPWNFPGEARNLPDRPSDPVETPLAESLSPTMGAYGAGQTLGESLNKFAQGDLKGSAETALPLLLGIFAGPGARTADMSMLARAKELAASGALREQIWGDTGWFQGPDQKWRFEIDDNKSRIPDSRVKDLYGNWEARGSAMRSGIEHPEFFDAYPEAKALSYRYTLNPTDTGGSGEFKSNTHLGGAGEAYPGGEGLIDAEASSPSDIHKIALHELMHYVQGKEGFSGGANPVDITRGYKSLLNDYNSQIGTINDSLQQAAGTPRYNELLDMRQHLVDEVHKIEGPFGVGAKEKGFDEYRREAGEVEARNVPGRLGLPFEGRPPPWETQDTPDIDQLLASRGSSSPMSAKSPTPPYPGDAQPDWAHWGVNAGKPTPMGDGTHLPLLNEQEAPIGSINYRDTPDGVFIDGAIGGKRDGIQGQASRAIKALMEHGAATGRPVTATATGGAGNFWNIMGFRREGHDSVFDADQLAKLQSGEINSTIWGHPRGYGDTFASTYGPGAEALRAAPDKR